MCIRDSPGIWCDDRLSAEHNGCRRSRKTREEQSGRKRLIHQPDERLEGHQQIGGETVRPDLSIADRRKRLDAEKERLTERAAERVGGGPGERLGTACQEKERKQQVQDEIQHRDDGDKSWP